MGCDIHSFPEYIIDNTDPSGSAIYASLGGPPVSYFQLIFDFTAYGWVEDCSHTGKWPMNRNYDFFAKLADVRNYDKVTPLCSGRGLPISACESTREEISMDFDYHSVTWASLEELLNIELLACGGPNYHFYLVYLTQTAINLNIDPFNIRVIFAFDN
jgi:hypothetical protein